MNTGLIFILWNGNYHVTLVATATHENLFSYHTMEINPVFIEKNLNILL
jgi:hypothetical protein